MPTSWLLNAIPAIRYRSAVLIALSYVLMLNLVSGHDVRTANVVLTNQNAQEGFSHVQFDLSWKSSWRYGFNSGINNWDAAWVFVKFKVGTTNPVFSSVSFTHGSDLVNLPSTAGLRVGMPMRIVVPGTLMVFFNSEPVIDAIISATQIRLSQNATVSFNSTSSNNQIEFQLIWEHARLHNGGHNPGTGFTVDPGLVTSGDAWHPTSNPVQGVMIHREAEGYGPVDLNGVQLRWNYANNGLSNSALVEVRVFAIEMVYVPRGSFAVGNVGAESHPFTLTTIATANASVTPMTDTNSLGGPVGGFPFGHTAPLSNYPNGFSAFYCMKYELSQGQYRDFLNTLTRPQQANRVRANVSVHHNAVINHYVMTNTNNLVHRNSIRCDNLIPAFYPINFYCDLNSNGIANEAADGEWIACNYMTWTDHAAYMEWAALRPMTELEFEKAARGLYPPLSNENAWGTSGTTAAAYTLLHGGSTAESIDANYTTAPNTGNAHWDSTARTTLGPLRVGLFAANANNRDRNTSGASFWGIMELSGNLMEKVVELNDAQGRLFTGRHGVGSLSRRGFATNSAWPGWAMGEVSQVYSSRSRGGGFTSSKERLRIGDRQGPTETPTTSRIADGSRGVRSVHCQSSLTRPIWDLAQPTLVPIGSTRIYKAFSLTSNNFIWLVPADWEIVSGQGTNQIVLQINSLPGTIRVAAVNSCGASELLSLTITTGN